MKDNLKRFLAFVRDTETDSFGSFVEAVAAHGDDGLAAWAVENYGFVAAYFNERVDEKEPGHTGPAEPPALTERVYSVVTNVILRETVTEEQRIRLNRGEHPAKVIPGFVDDFLREVVFGDPSDLDADLLNETAAEETEPAGAAGDDPDAGSGDPETPETAEPSCKEAYTLTLIGTDEKADAATCDELMLLTKIREGLWAYEVADCDNVVYCRGVFAADDLLSSLVGDIADVVCAVGEVIADRLGISCESVEFSDMGDADFRRLADTAGHYEAVLNASSDGVMWAVRDLVTGTVVETFPKGESGAAYDAMCDLNAAAAREIAEADGENAGLKAGLRLLDKLRAEYLDGGDEADACWFCGAAQMFCVRVGHDAIKARGTAETDGGNAGFEAGLGFLDELRDEYLSAGREHDGCWYCGAAQMFSVMLGSDKELSYERCGVVSRHVVRQAAPDAR